MTQVAVHGFGVAVGIPRFSNWIPAVGKTAERPYTPTIDRFPVWVIEIKLRISLVFTALLIPLLLGCQTNVLRSDSDSAAAGSSPSLPYVEPAGGPKELDSDIVYSYLVGELGTQRGDLATAYGHYLHAAILAHDAYAAERAARIALFRKDMSGALRATRRWVELAPNDPQARQHAILLFVREGQQRAAFDQAESLLKITDVMEQDGFVQLAGVLSKETDKANGLTLMREVTDRYSADARALFALGALELASGDPAAAETSLRRALEVDPDWSKPWVMLSRVLTVQGRDKEARTVLDDAVQHHPDDVFLRTAYARVLVDAEQYDQALTQFRHLREQEPEDDDIIYAQGMLAMQTKNWDEARDAWQALRNLGKRHGEATYYLAQVEEATDNKAVAAGLYASVTDGPLRTDSALRLALLKAKMGALKEAREILQQVRVLDVERSVDAYLAEVQVLQDHGRQKDVLSVFEAALQAHPGDTELLYSRAIYAGEIDRVDWVERDLSIVLEQNPENADALNALGYTLADKTDRFEEAFGYIRKAYKLNPESAAILDSMGWVYYRLGKLDLALNYLSQALERMQDPEIAAHFGEVLWMSGDKEKARQVWGEAYAANPEDDKLRAVIERFE